MEPRWMRRLGALLVLSALMLAGCASEEEPPSGTPDGEEPAPITVYSGREEEFIGPLFEQFEADTGIELDVRYGDSAELAATILEEGDSTPADVFVSQDAGSLGAVAQEGLFAHVDASILDRVDPRFRSSKGLWVGISGRARVAAYNTNELEAKEMPASILEFTDPKWKGRIGFAPTNGSFQAFVAAMIATQGEAETMKFLEGLAANDPKLYEDNSSTVRGVAAGEIEVGFVNHYYIYEVSAEDGDIPVANHFFEGGDPGALVNSAGAGVLAATDAAESGTALLDYLTGDEGQKYFSEETFEYPVVAGFDPSEDLVPLAEIESPDVDLSDLGGTLEPALKLLAEVGLL